MLVRVAVIIVTYQSETVIERCLRSVAAAQDGVALGHVVVVDNASADDGIDLARAAMPTALIIASPRNLGYAGAINLGRAHCGDAQVVLVLNPDTVLEPGSVARLASAALGPPPALAVPRLVGQDGSLSLSLRRFPSLRSAAAEAVLGGGRAGRWGLGEVVSDRRRYEATHNVDWATGAAVMIPSSGWDQLGDWDETFFLYGEETEFMARAGLAGFAVRYVPAATCSHVGGASGSSPDLWALLVTNKVRLYARTHGALSTAVFRVTLLAGQLARGTFGDPRSRAAAKALLRRRGDRSRLPSET